MKTFTCHSYGLRAATIIEAALNITPTEFSRLLQPNDIAQNIMDAMLISNNKNISDAERLMMFDNRFFKYVYFGPDGHVCFDTYEFQRSKPIEISDIRRKNIISKLYDKNLIDAKIIPIFVQQYVNRINNKLKLLNAEPITINDIIMIAEFEGNPSKAMKKFGTEALSKIIGKPLDPFKSELHMSYLNEISDNDFNYYNYSMPWGKHYKTFSQEERISKISEHYNKVLDFALKDYELLKM